MRSPLKFYIAAAYERQQELQAYKAELEARGHQVPARWLATHHALPGLEVPGTRIDETLGATYATENLHDVAAADVFIALTDSPFHPHMRGGRHAEFGIGLGLRQAQTLSPWYFVIGPVQNVFHTLADRRFETWDEFLSTLDTLPSIHGWDHWGRMRCDEHPWHQANGTHRNAYPTILKEGEARSEA